MARRQAHYMVDAFRQDSEQSPPVLLESARVVASNDDEAVREAELVRVRVNPTFIVVREVSRTGNRTVHKSASVFGNA